MVLFAQLASLVATGWIVWSVVASSRSHPQSLAGLVTQAIVVAMLALVCDRDTHDRLPVGKRTFPGIRRSPDFAQDRATRRMVGAHRNSASALVAGRSGRCPSVGDRHNADAVCPVGEARRRRRTAARSLAQVASSLRLRCRSGRPSHNRVPLDGSSAAGGRAALLQCSRPHADVPDRWRLPLQGAVQLARFATANSAHVDSCGWPDGRQSFSTRWFHSESESHQAKPVRPTELVTKLYQPFGNTEITDKSYQGVILMARGKGNAKISSRPRGHSY